MSAPTVFISYSWDDQDHKIWVRTLAAQLRQDGVDVTLDQWRVRPGDQLPAFMERAIRDNDYVLIVCTPKYKMKSDQRSGGVGYEGDVIQGEVFVHSNHRKFIPILRKGNWVDSAPLQLLGKAHIDLREGDQYSTSYRDLLCTLHGQHMPEPPLGTKPNLWMSPNGPPKVTTLVDESMSYGVDLVAITPDGRFAISGYRIENTFALWDLQNRRKLRTIVVRSFNEIGKHLSSVAIKADGRQALTACAGCLDLWDLETGRNLNLPYPFFEVYGADFVAVTEAWELAVCGSGNFFRTVDLKSGLLRHNIEAQPQGFWASRLTPYSITDVAVDGKGQLAASAAKTIKVWDVQSGRELRTLYGHSSSVTSVAMTQDGRLLASGSYDKTVRVWEPESGRELRVLNGHKDTVTDVAITANGRLLVSASNDRTIKIWNLETGQEPLTLDHSKSVAAATITPNGRFVVSGADDKTLKIWELDDN